MWWTDQERLTLTWLGACALLAVGVLVLQHRRPPLRVAGTPAPAHAVQWDGILEASRQVDVNAADVAALERLPEIGPALARRIVEYRDTHGSFRTPEELSRVQGIGPKTYEALEDYITTK